MSMTTELAQRMKAAALNATGAYERLSMMPEGDIFDISLAEGTQLDADITTLNSFHDEATPANVLELVEALEARDKQIAQQREYYEGVIADGGKRIAELEARTVKLPEKHCMFFRKNFTDDYQSQMAYRADEIRASLNASGVGIKDE